MHTDQFRFFSRYNRDWRETHYTMFEKRFWKEKEWTGKGGEGTLMCFTSKSSRCWKDSMFIMLRIFSFQFPSPPYTSPSPIDIQLTELQFSISLPFCSLHFLLSEHNVNEYLTMKIAATTFVRDRLSVKQPQIKSLYSRYIYAWDGLFSPCMNRISQWDRFIH